MNKKILVVCDSHVYSFSKIFQDSGLDDNITYLQILYYRNAYKSIVENTPLIHDEGNKWGISKELFKELVLKKKLVEGLIDFEDYESIIFIGHWLLDRSIFNIFLDNVFYFPDIYPQVSVDEGILLTEDCIKQVFSHHIERAPINAVKKIANKFNNKILIIPGPPISKGAAVASLMDRKLSAYVNGIESLFKIHRSVLCDEFKDEKNIYLPHIDVELKNIKSGFLDHFLMIDDRNIHANSDYGKQLFDNFIVGNLY